MLTFVQTNNDTSALAVELQLGNGDGSRNVDPWEDVFHFYPNKGKRRKKFVAFARNLSLKIIFYLLT